MQELLLETIFLPFRAFRQPSQFTFQSCSSFLGLHCWQVNAFTRIDFFFKLYLANWTNDRWTVTMWTIRERVQRKSMQNLYKKLRRYIHGFVPRKVLRLWYSLYPKTKKAAPNTHIEQTKGQSKEEKEKFEYQDDNVPFAITTNTTTRAKMVCSSYLISLTDKSFFYMWMDVDTSSEEREENKFWGWCSLICTGKCFLLFDFLQ